MIKINVLLLAAYCLILAGDLELNTPEGSLTLAIGKGTCVVEDGKINSAIVIDAIIERLGRLELMCRKYVKNSDIRMGEALAGEIDFLLGLLDRSHPVFITPYLPVPVLPMPDREFTFLFERLINEPFSDDQLNVVRTAAGSNFFLVHQVEKILGVFSFEDDRLTAVRILYPRILDHENAFKLYNEFTYSASKEALNIIFQSP